MSYQPPLILTPKILNLLGQINDQLGRNAERNSQTQTFRLRRANRIRTIQGSLAIEGNSLSISQITALLEGKPVIAPPKEVQEVKNALAVYERFARYNPNSEHDLLEAHRVLMAGLVDEIGQYRRGGVCVLKDRTVVHMAPPASQLPRLMAQLFKWLDTTDYPALITSAVFHYEFEFIHPFADGNGRMGRLWQSLILAKWNPLFANLPVESLVHANQVGYYQVIADSTDLTNCAPFVEYMLDAILKTLEEMSLGDELGNKLVNSLGKNLSHIQLSILRLLLQEPRMTLKEMAVQIGVSTTTIENNLKKLREQQLIQRVGSRRGGHWECLFSFELVL